MIEWEFLVITTVSMLTVKNIKSKAKTVKFTLRDLPVNMCLRYFTLPPNPATNALGRGSQAETARPIRTRNLRPIQIALFSSDQHTLPASYNRADMINFVIEIIIFPTPVMLIYPHLTDKQKIVQIPLESLP